MAFNLSQRSLSRLDRVHPALVAVVKRAIEVTKIDFGVIQGVRTLEQQKANVEAGRSQTMNSKHLPQDDGYSHAVDLMAYVGPRASWEISLYDDLADAMKVAARHHNVHIRWGGAWSVDDIRDWDGTME